MIERRLAGQNTTTTTTNDSGHSSSLGATGNFVWTVVSLPFRIGGIIGKIVLERTAEISILGLDLSIRGATAWTPC